MTTAELHRTQSLMTSTALNRLGYHRNYPHAVAFAPASVFGCRLIDLRIEQGLLQIQALLDYVGTEHRIGTVMVISLRQLQAEAGMSFDLLMSPGVAVPYLTDCWMLSLRQFCARYTVTLRVHNNRLPLPVRVGDSLLMDQALTLGLKRQQLIDLNLVRIYLRVTTVSDISTADSYMIHAQSWRGLRIPDRHSRQMFDRQETPSSYQRGLWRHLLCSLLHSSASSDMPLLLHPLGAWTGESHMRWGAMLHDSKLYRQDFSLPEHHLTPVAVHSPLFIPLSDGSLSTSVFYDSTPEAYIEAVPPLAVPADISGCHIFRVSSAPSDYPSTPPQASTFIEWIRRLPLAEQRLIETHYFTACDAEAAIVQYLQVECVHLIGTDGGKQSTRGSFSCIICAPDQDKLVHNEDPVDGWFRCQSSLRSEEAAIASLATYLDELAAFHEVDIRCTFQLYVDSMGAISNVTLVQDLLPKRRFPDNADLLSAMRTSHRVTARFCLEHVKSHQDETEDFANLPFSAQLKNVLADKQATKQLKSQVTNDRARTQASPLPTRGLPVEVFYDGQAISSHYVARLRDEICIRGHRDFLRKKYKWATQTEESIAWTALSTCAKRPGITHFSTRSKLVHNWLNLGSQRVTMSAPDLPTAIERNCPYCKEPEDFLHLLTCADSQAGKCRYDAMAVLRKTLSGGGPGP